MHLDSYAIFMSTAQMLRQSRNSSAQGLPTLSKLSLFVYVPGYQQRHDFGIATDVHA